MMSSHTVMMSSQSAVWQPCLYKGLHTSTKQTSRLQDSRPQDMPVAEQKDTLSRSQAIGTRQEATSEAKDHLITEVNKVDVGTDATVFVFTAPLLEGEPEVQHPTSCITPQPVPL